MAKTGTYIAPASTKDYNPVIAAVPMMGLLATVAFLSFYLIRHPVVWRPGSLEDGEILDRPNPVVGAGPSLRWEQVHCFFPVLYRNESCGGPLVSALLTPLRSLVLSVCDPFSAKQRVEILHGVSGAASCGELVGLLGPSGKNEGDIPGLKTEKGN